MQGRFAGPACPRATARFRRRGLRQGFPAAGQRRPGRPRRDLRALAGRSPCHLRRRARTLAQRTSHRQCSCRAGSDFRSAATAVAGPLLRGSSGQGRRNTKPRSGSLRHWERRRHRRGRGLGRWQDPAALRPEARIGLGPARAGPSGTGVAGLDRRKRWRKWPKNAWLRYDPDKNGPRRATIGAEYQLIQRMHPPFRPGFD